MVEPASVSYFDNFSPVGDLVVTAICYVMLILLHFSYVSRTKSYRIFLGIIIMLLVSSYADVVYYTLVPMGNPDLIPTIYTARILYHTCLFVIFFLYALYITVVTSLDRQRKRMALLAAGSMLIFIVGFDLLTILTGTGFHIAEDGTVTQGSNIFMIGYAAFGVLMVILLATVRNLLYKRVMRGFYATVIIAFGLQAIQRFFGQSSFTTASFLIPVVGMFYIMHSTPYNVTLGAVDSHALEDMIRYHKGKKDDFVFMSLDLREFDEEGKQLPEELQTLIRNYSTSFFRHAYLFQVANGHVILIAMKHQNPDYEERMQKLLQVFLNDHKAFNYEYRIVIGESIEEISAKNEYVSFIRSINRTMENNTVHRVTEEDIARFNRDEYILKELVDIHSKRDLDDPRVLAFCQPVYNIHTQRFDTAEALMRLKLDNIGLVFPDQFIPLAEEHGMIHSLTEIIFHKTCHEVRRLLEEGYEISRVSVNVSVLELKDENFCADINQIIDRNQIPGEKIAIELTESRNENDFEVMKSKIDELRQRGIKFYLDDFGTGYSNMERIMELPFDIIKFDRSMVIASGSSERSGRIVENLANMFREMKYSVLYEGVEDESDEMRCIDMSASYLQGYKYSRPIPIDQLEGFLAKAS